MNATDRIELAKGENIGDRLQRGRWYCIGFNADPDRLGSIDDFGPIYQFHGVDESGCGIWTDEARQFIDHIYDPTLGLECSPDGADFYVLQN